MAKSTGFRERRRRREELFSAGLQLESAVRHLVSSLSWAKVHKADADYAALLEALGYVTDALKSVRAEEAVLVALLKLRGLLPLARRWLAGANISAYVSDVLG